MNLYKSILSEAEVIHVMILWIKHSIIMIDKKRHELRIYIYIYIDVIGFTLGFQIPIKGVVDLPLVFILSL